MIRSLFIHPPIQYIPTTTMMTMTTTARTRTTHLIIVVVFIVCTFASHDVSIASSSSSMGVMAFAPTTHGNAVISIHRRIPSLITSSQITTHPSTTTTSLASAKILPVAYAGFSGALLYKAQAMMKGTTATPSPEAASSILVLLAVAALSIVNFSASDNAKLKSAKIAYHTTTPASAGKAKQQRQAALTWRKAVRIKILGQLVGLGRMVVAHEARGVMMGASLITAASLLYFLTGAGRSHHDPDGQWHPLPAPAVTGVFLVNVILFGAAWVAASASSSASSARGAARLYAAGAIVGSLEGIPQFVQAIQQQLSEWKECINVFKIQ